MASVTIAAAAMNAATHNAQQQVRPEAQEPRAAGNEIPRRQEASESSGDFVAIEIQSCLKGEGAFVGAKSLGGAEGDDQEICRVCHLSLRDPQSEASEDAIGFGSGTSSSKGMEAIELGCGCKDDLALAHRRCAETWFKIKGNRTCEICGKQAQNVGASGFDDLAADDASCGRRSDDQSDIGFNGEQQDEEARRFWHHRPICNFVLAFIVVILLLPWLFRIRLF